VAVLCHVPLSLNEQQKNGNKIRRRSKIVVVGARLTRIYIPYNGNVVRVATT
jgi:hypothetical protein